jgi:hypothetical protein
MLGSLLALLPVVGFVVATPTPRQNGLQTISNCEVSGQIALTFDGESGRRRRRRRRRQRRRRQRRRRQRFLLLDSYRHSAHTVRTADAATALDGPYIYETDVANALNGGLGTFFLNVSGAASGVQRTALNRLFRNEATVVESFKCLLTSLRAPPHLPSELPSQPCTLSATFSTTVPTTFSTTF